MVTKIIWEQPTWIKRDTEPATMWQVFEVALSDEANVESAEDIEFVQCTGYAPVSLSPGYNIEFFGPREYHKKYKRDVIKVKTIDFDTQNAKDSELIEISQHAKGISFKTLFALRQKFKDKLCVIIQNHPECLESISGFGAKKIKVLQTAVAKSSIEIITGDESNCQKISHFMEYAKEFKDIPKNRKISEWIKSWCDNDPHAISVWFQQEKNNILPLYCWNDHYAPSRKLLGQIENYCNHNGDGNDEMDNIMAQSHLFRLKMSTVSDSDRQHAQKNIKSLLSADEWITKHQDLWIKRLYWKCKDKAALKRLVSILMNDIDQIACIDTEFFVGKYPHTHRKFGYDIPLDVAIGRLYNIGIATSNGKSVSILIKHPNLSLSDRLNLFSSYYERQKMLEFLRPVLQHHINEEGAERIDVTKMEVDDLEYYFNRYAVLPRTAWDILSGAVRMCPYLVHHFSHWDEKLVCQLAEYCGFKEEFDYFEWHNTSKLCHGLFPNHVISRSLAYLSKRLCKDVDITSAEHQGGSDAAALMQLLHTLRGELVQTGFNVDNSVHLTQMEATEDKDESKDCELYRWLTDKSELPEYYELLCDEGFDDDLSLLCHLSDDDLYQMGIKKKAHRVKILNEANKLLYN